MKHILFLVLCVICISATAQRNKLNIGIEGSASSIFLKTNIQGIYPLERSIGFSTAATIQYNFPRIFSIRTNVAFERKGAKQFVPMNPDAATGSIDNRVDHHFDYLSLPLLLRATLGNRIQFFVNAGGYVGYLLKQQVKYTQNGERYTSDNTDKYTSLDAGMCAGGGLGLSIRKKIILSLELRYNGGLRDINLEKIAFPYYYTVDIKTSATNLLLGISYKLGER